MNRRPNRPPRFSRPLLLLAAALLFAPLACREDDDPERRRDFHAHRTLWRTLELDDYDFVLRRACFCPPALSYPTRVEVRDGAVVAATGIESGESVPVDEVPTIDDLFDIIESALEDRDREIALVNLGIPNAHARRINEAVDIFLDSGVQADLITVWVGANDLVDGVEPAEFEIELEQLLNRIDRETDGFVVIANLPDLTRLPRFVDAPDGDVTRERIEAFNAIIEDEAPIRRFLRASLTAEGYRVEEAEDARKGMRLVTQYSPDLVLLDLGLPDRDGKELVAEIRGWSSLPVVVLSARDQEREKVAALDAGADDYLTKTFGVGELMGRVKAVLRRADWSEPASSEQRIVRGEIEVDLERHKVNVRGNTVDMTPTEFSLLVYLMKNAGKALHHRAILQHVWGAEYGDEAEYLRVYVGKLRQKIESDPLQPRYLHTEHGIGYRFEA